MMRILDANALMVYFEREPAFEKVKSFFTSALDTDRNLLMTSVNYGEVYYIVLSRYGELKAREIENAIQQLPIEIVAVDTELAKQAARFKALKKMSYADCFAAALGKLRKGEVITGDKEFKEVEKEVKIAWI